MEKKTIGIAITGSFCTFDKMTGVIKTLTASGMRVIPIFFRKCTTYGYTVWQSRRFPQKNL